MGLLLIFLDPPTLITEPELTTDVATSISTTTAVLNGTVILPGGELLSERGFEINTIAEPSTAPSGKVYELGSFNRGSYSLNVENLTPGQTYYVRAYAKNSSYTGYGEWLQFIAAPSIYSIVIDGVDRTADIIYPSLSFEDAINDVQNTCQFTIDNRRGLGFPNADDEIVITMFDGTTGFAGYLVTVSLTSSMDTGVVMAQCTAVDYTRLLDSNLVHKTYENETDKAIIEDIVATYCAGMGITTNNVGVGATLEQISFNYLQPSQCFRKLAELTGRNWYIDYDKDIHYFANETNPAPFNIDNDSTNYRNLTISKDSSQIKNRVYVRGGTKLSDETTYSEKGDGEKRKFVLPDKPHDVTVKVNGVTQTLGIKNIDTSGFQFYLNYQEKYLEQDGGETILSDTDILEVLYKYDIPILVAVENPSSIVEHGQKEFAIFDKNITTTQSARDRAAAELIDYANAVVEGTFKTYETGFISGQYINITHTTYGISANYVVQKVKATSLGAGQYVYDISVASAKTMGIIKFLIELLEQNKNMIELDNNEVIDELVAIEDALLSDSLIDSLTIDSAGPYATWCTDSLQSDPATRAIWGLFQWG